MGAFLEQGPTPADCWLGTGTCLFHFLHAPGCGQGLQVPPWLRQPLPAGLTPPAQTPLGQEVTLKRACTPLSLSGEDKEEIGKVTFEELRQKVALFAAAMRKMGVKVGDRVVGKHFGHLSRFEGRD